jgi:hypothetical protein
VGPLDGRYQGRSLTRLEPEGGYQAGRSIRLPSARSSGRSLGSSKEDQALA